MSDSWVVLKFGGTSVTGLEQWKQIHHIINRYVERKQPLLVVCSAISQVSNHLERLASAAREGEEITRHLEEITALHERQARELGVSMSCIRDLLDDLKQLAFGASLIGEVSPKLWARILSAGELMSTRLGVAWLNQNQAPALWLDARELLVADETEAQASAYLSATITPTYQASLHQQLNELESSLVVTQGFIASNQRGDTVLLGRGGSDTSAAYFASMIRAERLEIWTDVPGLFTANPKVIPSARLLKQVSYEEAQELATTGAKVLHPRSIPPVQMAQIPLYVYSTAHPELEGTRIHHSAEGDAHIKGVSMRRGLSLISMDTVGMWQQAGFLAEVFTLFKEYELSIDLIATSETNVTVSLDPAMRSLSHQERARLLQDLSARCTPQWIEPVASVSLVGRHIRSILHQLAPLFERFANHKVHLLTQAASDLNLTVVVDESQAEPLLRELHHMLFSKAEQSEVLGPTWSQLFDPSPRSADQGEHAARATHPAEVDQRGAPWWISNQARLLEEAQGQTPTFIYHTPTLRQRAEELMSLESVSRVFYAIKANAHSEILTLFHQRGLGFECVSPQELDHIRALFPDLSRDRLLFTSNFVGPQEYAYGFQARALVTLDSIYPLRHWPEVFAGQEVLVRIDTGEGKGHHQYVVTAGNQSKFGIPPQDFDELIELTQRHQVKVIGLHAHSGSGILEADHWRTKAYHLYTLSQRFDEVKILNLGGGFGVPERLGQDRLDIDVLNQSLNEFKQHYPHLDLWIEPGRYLVAEAGVLLTKVTQLKTKGDRVYIGVDCGMNTLIRPALYGAWHQIENLTRLDQPRQVNADIVGPICESGDVLGRERLLPVTESGDVLVVGTAGAYGRAMSSHYNLRPPAREAFLGGDD